VSSFYVLCPMFSVSIFFGGVCCLLSVSCVQCSPCLSFLVGSVSSFCVLCPMFSVSIFFGGVRVFSVCLVSNVTRAYLYWWSVCLISASCAQCSPYLSFLVRSVYSFRVLCPMLPMSIFFGGVCVFSLRLVPNVLRVYLFWCGPCLLSVSCVQCYPCLSFLVECVSSFYVLCPMFSVSIFSGGVRVFFLCLVSNVTRGYLFWWGPCLLSASCAQCYP
jgi:hypothetical protein